MLTVLHEAPSLAEKAQPGPPALEGTPGSKLIHFFSVPSLGGCGNSLMGWTG